MRSRRSPSSSRPGVGRRQAADVVARLTGHAAQPPLPRLAVVRFDNSRAPDSSARMVVKSGNTLRRGTRAARSHSCSRSPAGGWAWPVDGPVLQPFASEGDPYAGGQHRGIDIGRLRTGRDVRSPPARSRLVRRPVAAEGPLRDDPHRGRLLDHARPRGSIGVPSEPRSSEGDVVGDDRPDRRARRDVSRMSPRHPRSTADPNGYVDPLSLLPPRQAPEQVPPVQQTSQVQAPAPPVAARHAGPVARRPAAPACGRGESTCPATIRGDASARDSAMGLRAGRRSRGSTQRGLSMPGARVPRANRSCAELARATFRGAPDPCAGAAGASC